MLLSAIAVIIDVAMIFIITLTAFTSKGHSDGFKVGCYMLLFAFVMNLIALFNKW